MADNASEEFKPWDQLTPAESAEQYAAFLMFCRLPPSRRRKGLSEVALAHNVLWRDVKGWHDAFLWTERADAWRDAIYRDRIEAHRERAKQDLAAQTEVRASILETQLDTLAVEWTKRNRTAHETPVPTMSEGMLARTTRDAMQQVNNDLGKPNEIIETPTDYGKLSRDEFLTVVRLQAKARAAASEG